MSGPIYEENFDRYMVVWKTNRTWPAGCRQLVLTLENGEELRLTMQVVRLPF